MPGHVRRRGKESWAVVVDLGRDEETGKRLRLWRSVKGKRSDADALLVQLLHQRDTGIDEPPGKMKLGQFLNQWFEDYARPNVAPKTLLQYRYLLDRHIIPGLGHLDLAKMRPTHVQNFYGRCLTSGRADGNGGLSGKTVLHIHRLLHQALNHAVKWQMLVRNPVQAAEPPRAGRYAVPILSRDEVQRILEAADRAGHGALVHTAVMTGLRRGEITGLHWSDCDLDAGVIRVRQTVQWLPHEGFHFKEPKTDKSRRVVAIGPSTVNILREHRRTQLEQRLASADYQYHGLVFAAVNGRPIDPSNLRRAWRSTLAASGIGKHLRWHDLRHVHASLMLIGGTHPAIVAERLGHSDVRVTLNTYTHCLPNLQVTAAAELDRWMTGTE